jgi:hypothetical protein
VLSFETAKAQQQEVRLADEYFQKGEFDKAKPCTRSWQEIMKLRAGSTRITSKR